MEEKFPLLSYQKREKILQGNLHPIPFPLAMEIVTFPLVQENQNSCLPLPLSLQAESSEKEEEELTQRTEQT